MSRGRVALSILAIDLRSAFGAAARASLLALALAGPARAEAVPSVDRSGAAVRERTAGDELGDQAIGVDVGVAAGGDFTPGGLKVSGHYLYQLSQTDWFDGTAGFTFGGGGRGCEEGEMGTLACDHSIGDGNAVELSAIVRRVFAPRGAYRPFALAGVGVSMVRYAGDDLTGVAFPVRLGGGLRTSLSPSVSLVTQADVMVGIGAYGRGLGVEPLIGMSVSAGAEFRLR